MGQFKCANCGLKAYSKNPMTRNVFPSMDDIGSTVVQARMTFKIEPDPYRTGKNDLVIKMSLYEGDKDDLAKAIEEFHGLMQELTIEDLTKGTCRHDWQPVNGPEDYEV